MLQKRILKWNLGLLVIRVGYAVRDNKYGEVFPANSLRGKLGRWLLQKGYSIRGDVPQKRWWINNI